MEKRLYPSKSRAGSGISLFLLLLTALVIVSGLWGGRNPDGFVMVPAPTVTPIPLDENFDETMTEVEIDLPSSMWYALQLGAFESEESAKEMAVQFARRGASGYVWPDGRYRALAAVYPSKEDAQQVRQQLETQHGIDTYLYQIDLPSVRIRMKGMRGQLEILQAAFLHVDDLIRQLQDISMSIDRRELNTDEAIDSLKGLDTQLTTVSLRLHQRFQAPRHEAVQSLLGILESFHTFCVETDAKRSSIALASSLKHQTLSALQGFWQIYDTLIHRR